MSAEEVNKNENTKSVQDEAEDLLTQPKEEDEEVETEKKQPVKEPDAQVESAEKEENEAAATLTNLNANHEDSEEDEEEDDAPADDSDFKIPLKLTKSGRRRATPFPLKLMKVLSNKEFADIVAWTESGKAFNILQPKLFTANILPAHFKQAKYSSFTRKLHRWGFMRHYRGPEAGAFFHKHFRRGRMDLAEKMSCAKPGTPPSKSIKAKTSSTAQNPLGMSFLMDTSGSSRDGLNNNSSLASMMGNTLGLPQLPSGVGLNAFMQQQLSPQLLMQGLGAFPAAAQQQMLLQQQAMAAMQQQQQQQHVNTPSGDSSLDAAIEMEVARRIKERINAAALSRQTLMMQQQQPQPQGFTSMPTQGQASQMQPLVQQSMIGAGHSMLGGTSPNLQGLKGLEQQQATNFGLGGSFPDAFMMSGGKAA